MMSEALPSKIPVGVVIPDALAASLTGLKLLVSLEALAAGRADLSVAEWLGDSILNSLASVQC